MSSSDDPFSQCLDKYNVHPEAYEQVRRGLALGLRNLTEMTVEEARDQSRRNAPKFCGQVDFPGAEMELTVPSPHCAGGIPVTVYTPDSVAQVPAILTYFHGGGLVIGSRKSHESCLKTIARDSGAIILSVEYRLLPLPESPLAPFQDGLTALRWVLQNKTTVGGHVDSMVGVGGDSAGGQISAGLTSQLGPELDFQVLVYPMTDVKQDYPSFKEFTTTPGLTRQEIGWFFSKSIAHMADREKNPLVNPACQSDSEISASPPTIMVLAELDALRDCGVAFADRLRASGVKVTTHLVKGVPHAFFRMVDTYPTKTKEAYSPIVEFIKTFHKQ